VWASLNASNYADASITGFFDDALNTTVETQASYFAIIKNPKTGYVDPSDYQDLLVTAFEELDAYSLLAVGYQTWAAEFDATSVTAAARQDGDDPPALQADGT